MDGYELAAVIVVCVTVLAVALLWAMVRIGQQTQAAVGPVTGGVRTHGGVLRSDIRRKAAEAALRAGGARGEGF